jgi:MEDS: MEthanogen/methylotroph, DcmR Sensory domain
MVWCNRALSYMDARRWRRAVEFGPAVCVHARSLVTRHEVVVRGQIASEHRVQLFDDAESLAGTVAAFLFEGWRLGEPLLVAARPAHWALISRDLAARGCAIEQTIGEERLVVLDAAATLATFLQNGHPLPDRFSATVARVVGDLSTRFGTRLRIYGEMVDILAAQGEFAAAHRLEQLWNQLATAYSVTLLCGYEAGHFGDPRSDSVLRDICEAHDHATAGPHDLLASWLLAGRQPRLHTQA